MGQPFPRRTPNDRSCKGGYHSSVSHPLCWNPKQVLSVLFLLSWTCYVAQAGLAGIRRLCPTYLIQLIQMTFGAWFVFVWCWELNLGQWCVCTYVEFFMWFMTYLNVCIFFLNRKKEWFVEDVDTSERLSLQSLGRLLHSPNQNEQTPFLDYIWLLFHFFLVLEWALHIPLRLIFTGWFWLVSGDMKLIDINKYVHK